MDIFFEVEEREKEEKTKESATSSSSKLINKVRCDVNANFAK